MLNFAIVGCGRIAKRHSELLGLRQIEGAYIPPPQQPVSQSAWLSHQLIVPIKRQTMLAYKGAI
jgi:hypothetical protein